MQVNTANSPYEILPSAPLYDWRITQSILSGGDYFNVRDILPYKKMRAQLSYAQLLELLDEAHVRMWKVLDLSNYKLSALPEEPFRRLNDVEVLILGSGHDHSDYVNTFDKLPDSIGDMTNLKVLAVNNVPLTELPDTLSKLMQLQYLDISGNKTFSTFPDIVYTLKNLRVLRISYATSLKKRVKPYAISGHLGKLTMLERLFISGDGFVALPNEIGTLPHLEHLFISRTGIKSLPDAITNSRMLKELILFENNINSLPNSIGSIGTLTTLKLMGEQIEFIPKSMISLSKLIEFTIEDTPLEQKVPPSIQKDSPKSMIKFLLNIQNEELEKAPPNESKMLIVGQGGVGKTSLLNRLIYDTYSEEPSTEGIDIHEWHINKDDDDADGDKILRIWDFGGQEIYHATHQFFLSERSLYVLVWDARQDNEYGRIDYWLNTINLYAKDCPVFMIVNKCDSKTPEPKIDIEKYKERFPNLELPLYKTSCKDRTKSIDELRRHLKEKATDLPLMHQKWPKNWITIRSFLLELYREKGLHYIEYDRYLQICKNNNVDEPEAETLIKCLHDLGFVLCFRNDQYLGNWVILEKEWGTKAVYQVLNYKEHLNGIVDRDDLNIIWSDKKIYPTNMHPVLLQLMLRFQISFALEDGSRYLVAELLRYGSIPMLEGYSGSEALNYRCQYAFLPAGVMSRFIVASHEYILEANKEKQCWLKGAYLKNDDGVRAKIELFDDAGENYISIRVWSGEKNRATEFFNEIHSVLMSINNSIPNVRYTEVLRCNCKPECEHFFKYDTLNRYRSKGVDYIICENSVSDVDIKQLLTDYRL